MIRSIEFEDRELLTIERIEDDEYRLYLRDSDGDTAIVYINHNQLVELIRRLEEVRDNIPSDTPSENDIS